jgi:hypothetical protein
MRILLYIMIFSMSSATALAADEQSPTHWWQIVSGILAIPTAIGTLIFGLATLKKTRLESKKIELELREKEASIANMPGVAASGAHEIAQSLVNPLIDNNRVNYLILRFVVIFLLLQFWQIFEKLFALVGTGTVLTLQQVFKISVEGLPMLLYFSLSQVVQFSWIVLVLVLGLPLYRDISTHIGFRIWTNSKS